MTATLIVVPSAPPPQGEAQRISFAPGGVSATVQGTATPAKRLTYVITAGKTQTMSVSLTGSGRLGLGVVGPGAVLQKEGDGKTSWSGVLDLTGDYILFVEAFDGPVTFTLKVTIPPAPAPSATAGHACAVPTSPAADGASWALYCSTAYGFGFRYPPAEVSHLDTGDRIALPIAQGTNLSEKFLMVVVQENAADCSAASVNPYQDNVEQTGTATFNGTTFKKETGAGVGAGNIYQWVTYSTAHGTTCLGMTFVLHSGNIGNYATPPAEFDEAAESAVFEQIMTTFSWPGA